MTFENFDEGLDRGSDWGDLGSSGESYSTDDAAITAPDDYDSEPETLESQTLDPVEAELTEPKFADFREPFDGMQPEIPVAEQKEAGALFSDFVAGELGDAVRDKFRKEEDGITTSVEISDSPSLLEHPDIPEGKRISLERIGPDETHGEVTSYNVYEEGVVIRTDTNESNTSQADIDAMSDKIAAMRPITPLGIDSTDEQIADALTQLSENIGEIMGGFRLEEQLGINHQPVGPAEIARLIDFVRRR